MNVKLKANLTILGLSLAILLTPSIVIAIGLALFFGHFVANLLIAFAVFFVIGQISNIFAQRRAELDMAHLKARLAEIAHTQSMEVSCSYCKVRNVVPIRLNQRNTFACSECKGMNLIVFQFATVQVSVPLELPQLGAQVLNEQQQPTPKQQ